MNGSEVDTSVVLRRDCPGRPVLDQIGDRWSVMVMAALERPGRFSEVERRLDGITHKVLNQALRRLERNGMVGRRVLATSPVGVEYSLTPLGRSLRAPFEQLYGWAAAHADEIELHQLDYDRRY